MFGIKLWSRFGSFRDPLTITQNLTLPLPPKTTIGGMLAAILGIDYNDYFNDPDFFSFRYSVVLNKSIRKKSFAQNYIEDYTEESEKKLNALKNSLDAYIKYVNKKFPKPKPIFRELLIEPEYLIFIKNFKYENKAAEYLKNHFSVFNFYMGNSEFAANYSYIPCSGEECISDSISSFSADPDKILYEAGKKYISMFSATKTNANRTYGEYKKLIISDQDMKLKKSSLITQIKTDERSFNCEFV